MKNTLEQIDYARIVNPLEMQDAKQWLAEMLAVLTVVPDPRRTEAEITWYAQGWGQMRCGVSVIETPICLDGKSYETGLGTHADSRILVRLPSAAKQITGVCGVDDHEYARHHALPITFAIRTGKRSLWTSGPRKVSDKPARFAVDLGGAREFELLATAETCVCAPADWGDLKVELQDGRFAILGEPECGDAGFRFTYGGRLSTDFLSGWKLKKECKAAKDGIVLHRITRTDPKTGLAVICEIKEYTEFPVLEWGLRLKNTSTRKTPILEEIRSLDIRAKLGKFPYLNHWTGDYCSPDGYEPFRESLAHGEEYCFAPLGGRPTNRAWPYYNLEYADSGRGLIAVVGWSGQWAARFQGLEEGRVRIEAGQELTHFVLLPGEEVRTPLSVLLFWRGDTARSQNLWRRWMMACNMPRPGGQPMKPHLACCGTDEGEEFTAATEENQIRYLDKFRKRGIKPDVWWIDAGWYSCYDEKKGRRRWWRTGTWEPDPERFPRGLKPVSDHAAKAGADLLVWFEPERVTEDSKLDRERPEWLLRNGADSNRLLDLGNPACRKWLTDHVCRLIRDNGIKIYRQDFNFDPLPFWRGNEPKDRQGITENHYVQGYLQYWDALLARNPGLWIDSCASGGRRNDLETMRRSVPLHYTDHGYGDHPVKLAFQRGLMEWIPYFKEFTLSWDLSGNVRFDPKVDSFSFHCGLAPMLFATLDIRRDDYDFALVTKMIGVWRCVADLILYGDYYPLTPYHRSPSQWVAKQFDRPEEGRGYIQAIRLPKAPADTLTVYLQALKPEATYRFENPETGEIKELSGTALQRRGFTFALPKRAGAIWTYLGIERKRK